MLGTIPVERAALSDMLEAPPEGHSEAVEATCGTPPWSLLRGPMPPGWCFMALIAAPMLGHTGTLSDLGQTLAESGYSEWEWRAALLPYFPEPEGDE